MTATKLIVKLALFTITLSLATFALCACNPEAPSEPPTPALQWSITGNVLLANNNAYNLKHFSIIQKDWTGIWLFSGPSPNHSWISLGCNSSMTDSQFAELRDAIAQAWNQEGGEQE